MRDDLTFDPPLRIAFSVDGTEIGDAYLEALRDESVTVTTFADFAPRYMPQYQIEFRGLDASPHLIFGQTKVAFKVTEMDREGVQVFEGEAILFSLYEGILVGGYTITRSTVDTAASELIEEIERFLARHP